MTLVMVKLGGSLLTDKNRKESLRKATLKRLCREIHSARKKRDLRLIVGHGGGSFPHYPAHKYRVADGLRGKESLKGFALTNDAAARLNRFVVKELVKAGENAVSVQPSAWMVKERGRVKKAFIEPFKLYLKNGLLPVPYGDAVADYGRGVAIASTEEILGELALRLGSKRMLVVAKTAGVFTDDPLKNKKAELVPLINKGNYAHVRKMLKGSYGRDVTGGMLQKVDELYRLARKGVSCRVISGEEKGALREALLGKKLGTLVR